jgi:hypothetical protein
MKYTVRSKKELIEAGFIFLEKRDKFKNIAPTQLIFLDDEGYMYEWKSNINETTKEDPFTKCTVKAIMEENKLKNFLERTF